MSTTHERSEIVPIWQTEFEARWLVSVTSTTDDNDPWSGWLDVDANARTGKVVLGGDEFTPAEARHLAEALRLAADHAEHFGDNVANILDEMTAGGRLPEIAHLPTETQCAIRDALREAAARYRSQQAKNARR